jgi:hypothetical protein
MSKENERLEELVNIQQEQLEELRQKLQWIAINYKSIIEDLNFRLTRANMEFARGDYPVDNLPRGHVLDSMVDDIIKLQMEGKLQQRCFRLYQD